MMLKTDRNDTCITVKQRAVDGGWNTSKVEDDMNNNNDITHVLYA